ncbi:MAG: phosphoribosylanthranilate isomerase [Candidatus Promineifilaceae bacterium]|nr:phosphoribosylanthranilate isomerase [Candidatus Promineifilaceae bacterium]
MPVRVKICGLTQLEDAVQATDAGADFLGFIFYPPSKRAIRREAAQTIVARLRALPHCPRLVGVFVDESAATVAATLDQCALDLAQLSGSEPPALVGDPSSPLYGRSYKALRPTSQTEAEADAEWFVAPAGGPESPSLLLDAYHPTLPGGTGRTVDWELAAGLAQQIPRLMLAGGLTPANVAQAVQQVHPFAVDVASGVEAEPGRKDPHLVRAFIQAAKSVTDQ